MPQGDRELVFTLAADSTFFWRSGGKKSSLRINMAEPIANNLTQAQTAFKEESTSIVAIDCGDMGLWAKGVREILPLAWVDEEEPSPYLGRQRQFRAQDRNDAKMACRVRESGTLAAAMFKIRSTLFTSPQEELRSRSGRTCRRRTPGSCTM